MVDKVHITIVGAGSWGTTLGIIIARRGIPVTLLARTLEESNELQNNRRNLRFIPNAIFPDGISITNDLTKAFSGATLIILAVPCNSMRENANLIKEYLKENPVVLSVSKGLDIETGKTMSSVLQEVLREESWSQICVLSGPNLASEILAEKPASAVVASKLSAPAQYVQKLMISPLFRIYTNRDVMGVELGGALKNIIAIGAGICDGLHYGENSKSAFITRGLAEISRLGIACGADPSTFYGLAGLGDLIATCASPLSRNHWVGKELAAGKQLPNILGAMPNIAEGVNTTCAAMRLSQQLEVEVPIMAATYQILFEGMDPREAVSGLMERPAGPEY